MVVWRLLPLETQQAFANMAIDESILTARISGKVPNTLRLYRWFPSAVSIGRFQDIKKEVDLSECHAHDVSVVRRISGGGAVYHDSQGEITYSVIVGREDLGTDDIAELYILLCNGLIEAMNTLGIKAGYNPGSSKQCPNITVDYSKISGSAQAQRRKVVLQHGTLLLNVDLNRMFKFLKRPSSNSIGDLIKLARQKITSVEDLLGKPVSIEEVLSALRKGFEKTLDMKLVSDSLTSYECALAKRLEKEKFSTDMWNLQGRSSFSVREPVS